MAFLSFDNIAISGISSAIPKQSINLDSFGKTFGKNAVDVFKRKYGIQCIHKSDDQQTASDLGFVAAKTIMDEKQILNKDIGFIIFISKTPDYRSPATATVLHNRLALTTDCIAFDINHGGSGFLYGLQAGCSLLDSLNSRFGIIIVGDTASKQVSPMDPLSMMYGDGASAILLEKKSVSGKIFILTNSDSSHLKSFIITGGGFRPQDFFGKPHSSYQTIDNKNRSDYLSVDESVMLRYESEELPGFIKGFIEKCGSAPDDYDFFALYQDSRAFMEDIVAELKIPLEKITGNISRYGNTGGCSVPLLLSDSFGSLEQKNLRILSSGFGEGFSYGAADFTVNSSVIFPVIETGDHFTDGAVSHDLK